MLEQHVKNSHFDAMIANSVETFDLRFKTTQNRMQITMMQPVLSSDLRNQLHWANFHINVYNVYLDL